MDQTGSGSDLRQRPHVLAHSNHRNLPVVGVVDGVTVENWQAGYRQLIYSPDGTESDDIFNSNNNCTILILLLHVITYDLLLHILTLTF